MRILLVEDDEMIGEAVADGLKGEGYAVDWVKDGNSAIIALDTTPFSLVILDLGLPGKDGLLSLIHILIAFRWTVLRKSSETLLQQEEKDSKPEKLQPRKNS